MTYQIDASIRKITDDNGDKFRVSFSYSEEQNDGQWLGKEPDERNFKTGEAAIDSIRQRVLTLIRAEDTAPRCIKKEEEIMQKATEALVGALKLKQKAEKIMRQTFPTIEDALCHLETVDIDKVHKDKPPPPKTDNEFIESLFREVLDAIKDLKVVIEKKRESRCLRGADKIEAEQEEPKICIHCHREYYPNEKLFHIRHCSCELTPRELESLAVMAKLERLLQDGRSNIKLFSLDSNGRRWCCKYNHEDSRFSQDFNGNSFASTILLMLAELLEQEEKPCENEKKEG